MNALSTPRRTICSCGHLRPRPTGSPISRRDRERRALELAVRSPPSPASRRAATPQASTRSGVSLQHSAWSWWSSCVHAESRPDGRSNSFTPSSAGGAWRGSACSASAARTCCGTHAYIRLVITFKKRELPARTAREKRGEPVSYGSRLSIFSEHTLREPQGERKNPFEMDQQPLVLRLSKHVLRLYRQSRPVRDKRRLHFCLWKSNGDPWAAQVSARDRLVTAADQAGSLSDSGRNSLRALGHANIPRPAAFNLP